MKTVAKSKNYCCVPSCSASSRYNSIFSFHRFPQDATLRAKWVHKIRRAEFKVTQDTKVCNRHFEGELIQTTVQVLSRNAVP